MVKKGLIMAKEVITITNRPKTSYSPGTKARDYIFVSGQVGLIGYKGMELKGVDWLFS